MSAMLQGIPKEAKAGKTVASEPRKGNAAQSGHVRFRDEITNGGYSSRGGYGGGYGDGGVNSYGHGVGSHGVGSHGVGSHGVGSHGLAPPRSALHYTPPTSFLDAVEKPSAVPRRDAIQDLMFF